MSLNFNPILHRLNKEGLRTLFGGDNVSTLKALAERSMGFLKKCFQEKQAAEVLVNFETLVN